MSRRDPAVSAAVPRQVYLLAAGWGKRAGTPKAWRLMKDKPLLRHQLDFLLPRFKPAEVAVSIQEAWLEQSRTLAPEVCWVPTDPDAPPMGSLISLLRARPAKAWSFVYHVDMAVWEPALFEVLSANAAPAQADGKAAVAPVHEGRQGHPVLLSPEALEEVAALDPARDRLDVWLRDRTRRVEVPFACVHSNWNSK